MEKLINAFNTLYNYGEIKLDIVPENYQEWLISQGWLVKNNEYLLISKRWINLSALTNIEEDFINHLLVFYPEYQQYLLINLLEIGSEISNAEDTDELVRYVSSLPKYSVKLMDLCNEIKSHFDKEIHEINNSEWNDLKSDYTCEVSNDLDILIFGGNIQYEKLLNMLKLIQNLEFTNTDTQLVSSLTNSVDKNWIKGRKVTSNPFLKPVIESKYSLVPVKEKIEVPKLKVLNKYLNNPWGIFLILLGMVEKQLRAEKNDRINLRPSAETEDPYNPKQINFYTYLEDGREVLVGSLEYFTKGFLDYLEMEIFPANKFILTDYFSELLNDKLYIYKHDEYIMSEEIDSLLYKRPLMIALKKYAKKFTLNLKEYVERLADSYED
ncbi:MAG: hypothetical protein ACOCRO_05500 [Halanaerobiales bacterium]